MSGAEAGTGIVPGFEGFRNTYFEECAELLDTVYASLNALGEGRADDETVHALFRAVHSMKGGGGAFGFQRLVAFAHGFETLLDMLRDGRVALDANVLPLMLRATDLLADLVTGARTGAEPPAGQEAEVLKALLALADGGAAPVQRAAPVTAAAATEARDWHIGFVPRTSLYTSANEPLYIFRELARLGEMRAEPDLSRVPDLTALDPAEACIGWTLHLHTTAPEARIAEAFEFVTEDCALSLEVAAPPPPAQGGQPPAEAARAAGPLAEASPQGRSIRIDVEKIDRLVNLVGELVINQSMLSQISSGLRPELCPGLASGLETLSQHLRELQEGVMAIRAQPVRSVFSRMPRLVREVAGQLGKDIRLVVTGEGTEIDKTVVEQLADPLTHLLRNSLDHGIEPPAERLAAGKPAQGCITLSAEHRSGRIVIEVADDGRGIDRAKVLAKARQRGLVAEDASLGAEEIEGLIFLPGFSTAEAVSSISGRGVGMDVVRRNIQALGGRIAVASTPGQGSRFTLSLPLTLAILDGMAVAVGAETYIIPLTNIMESLRPQPAVLHAIVGRGDVLAIRGEYVPLVRLHEIFAVPAAVHDPCRGLVVIVESDSTGRFGIVVDEMLGQQQVVVKSLEANYGPVEGIGGATILGNGRVALILDVARLQEAAGVAALRRAEREGRHAAGRH